jgi:ribosomal protein L22
MQGKRPNRSFDADTQRNSNVRSLRHGMTTLHQFQKEALGPLEKALKEAVSNAEPEAALELAGRIQELFPDDRKHPRLLRAKLWAYEACVDANRLTYAESGLIGVRRLAGSKTRLHLEASGLLAVTMLRQKKTSDAKKLIREVIRNINNITSDRTRHQFQKRFIQRVEEECILAELIDSGDGPLDIAEIEAKAILLLDRNSDEEILKLIGNSVPSAGIALLGDVRNYSLQQLPPPDRLLLPPPEKAEEPKHIGRTTFALLRRIAWKTFCKPNSPVYKLWSSRITRTFNEGYFAAAVVAALSDFRIGVPLIASGLAALAMKYTAEEFCAVSKPKGLMISPDDKAI